jgi:hypothetical protein
VIDQTTIMANDSQFRAATVAELGISTLQIMFRTVSEAPRPHQRETIVVLGRLVAAVVSIRS